MMRSSWFLVAVFDARYILAANLRMATRMQFNLSHVGSQARAGAVAEAAAGAGATRVIILCGGHATKSNEKLTDTVDNSGTLNPKILHPNAQLTSNPVESGAKSQRCGQPNGQLTGRPRMTGAHSTDHESTVPTYTCDFLKPNNQIAWVLKWLASTAAP